MSKDNVLNNYQITAEDEVGNNVCFSIASDSRRNAVISFNRELSTLVALSKAKNKNKDYVLVDIKEVESAMDNFYINTIKVDHLKC